MADYSLDFLRVYRCIVHVERWPRRKAAAALLALATLLTTGLLPAAAGVARAEGSSRAAAGNSNATLVWDMPAPMPSSTGAFAAVGNSNGKIYVFSGSSDTYSVQALDVFDPIANSWATGPNVPTARHSPGVAAMGGKVYVIGGYTSTPLGYQSISTAEAFDPSTNTWSELPPMPTARLGLSLVAGGDGKLYAIGGTTVVGSETSTTVVEAYDPATQTWESRAPFPAPPPIDSFSQLAALGSDGRIYLLLSINTPTGRASQLDAYDPTLNQWTTIDNAANAPTSTSWFALVSGSGGNIYAFGETAAVYNPLANAWTSIPPPPVIDGEALDTAALGGDGRIYAFPSVSNTVTGAVAVYNPATEFWIPYAEMPTHRTDAKAVALSDGSVYAIGGDEGVFGPVNVVEQYVPATDAWIKRASVPNVQGNMGVAATASNQILSIGGSNGTVTLSTVESYDPTTDSWSNLAPLPEPLMDMGAARGMDGRIYVAGGTHQYAPVSPLSTAEAYNPATNSWTSLAPMLARRAGFSLVAASDGLLYAIGGDASSGYAGTVEAYNPTTNSWTWRANLPSPYEAPSAVAGSDGKIYAIGGPVSGQCCESRVDVYDPATNTWTASTSLPTSAFEASAVADGNDIYVLGGIDYEGGISGAVERGTLCPSSQASADNHARVGARTMSVPFQVFLPFATTGPWTVCR